jgi:hypothetical protein
LVRHIHLIKRETGLDLHPAERDGLGARDTQGRVIAGDLLILKIALKDAGGRVFHRLEFLSGSRCGGAIHFAARKA